MIWTHHDFSKKSAAERLLLKGLSAGMTHCVCVSKAVRKSILEYGYSEARCRIIPDGIDLNVWKPRGGVPDRERMTLASISRFEKWKGFDVVVDCIGLLKERIGASFTWLVGSLGSGTNTYEKEIVERIRSRGLEDVTAFVQFMPHEKMPDVISGIDIFVHLPIEPEPLGIVILEAMAMEKVVVAAGHGGITDIIDDGVNGFLVKPGDASGTIDRILSLLESRGEFKSIGTAARKKIAESFDARSVAKSYENLYSTLSKK